MEKERAMRKFIRTAHWINLSVPPTNLNGVIAADIIRLMANDPATCDTGSFSGTFVLGEDCSERIARRKTDNETGNEDRRNGTRGLTRSLDSLCLDIISMIFRFEDYLTTFAVCVVSTVVLKWFMVANQFTNVYNFVLILFSENFPRKFICIYVNKKNIFINLYHVNSKICWLLSNFNNFQWIKCKFILSIIDRSICKDSGYSSINVEVK